MGWWQKSGMDYPITDRYTLGKGYKPLRPTLLLPSSVPRVSCCSHHTLRTMMCFLVEASALACSFATISHFNRMLWVAFLSYISSFPVRMVPYQPKDINEGKVSFTWSSVFFFFPQAKWFLNLKMHLRQAGRDRLAGGAGGGQLTPCCFCILSLCLRARYF